MAGVHNKITASYRDITLLIILNTSLVIVADIITGSAGPVMLLSKMPIPIFVHSHDGHIIITVLAVITSMMDTYYYML